jgi:predicted methyltransferase
MNRRRFLYAFAALSIVGMACVLISAWSTIEQLDSIERARDQWQHPSEIIAALGLRSGDTVIDLGSGAGYFSLKLATEVGEPGRVEAVDLRRLSLLFLQARTLRAGHRNIHTALVEPDDPQLTRNSTDAVLICNTYHELKDRPSILRHVHGALRSGGRLVIADREPRGSSDSHHEIAVRDAVVEVQAAGFQITRSVPTLLTDAEGEVWWLLVAQKP